MGLPTMLMLAYGNHVAVVQHPLSFRRRVMSFSKTVQKIKSHIAFYKDLAKDTEGASGIEYAIIAGMVAVVLATFVAPISTAVTAMFNTISAAL
jgi:pilus assembly protein Flp/PilA